MSLSGLQPVHASPIAGRAPVENYNCQEIVNGSEYHAKIRQILHLVGIGDVNCERYHSQYFATGAVSEGSENSHSNVDGKQQK